MWGGTRVDPAIVTGSVWKSNGSWMARLESMDQGSLWCRACSADLAELIPAWQECCYLSHYHSQSWAQMSSLEMKCRISQYRSLSPGRRGRAVQTGFGSVINFSNWHFGVVWLLAKITVFLSSISFYLFIFFKNDCRNTEIIMIFMLEGFRVWDVTRDKINLG